MITKLFEIEKETEIFEIKKVKNTVYTIDSLTINLSIILTQDGARFIDNAVIFYRDVKKAASINGIKLNGFKTDKVRYSVDFKATGTLQNLNNLLFQLNSV
jgi:hypothetical protein